MNGPFVLYCIEWPPTAEENPRRPQQWKRLTKTLRSVIASNEILYLQMTSVDRTARQGWRRKEIRKGWGDKIIESKFLRQITLACNFLVTVVVTPRTRKENFRIPRQTSRIQNCLGGIKHEFPVSSFFFPPGIHHSFIIREPMYLNVSNNILFDKFILFLWTVFEYSEKESRLRV